MKKFKLSYYTTKAKVLIGTGTLVLVGSIVGCASRNKTKSNDVKTKRVNP